MFRKIFLSNFPEQEIKNQLSPIRFHLKLVAPKLFFGISIKNSLTNRRVVQSDMRLSYFQPLDIVFKNFNDENYFYSYKIYANLNSFDNISFPVVCQAVSLYTFYKFFYYLPEEKFLDYLNPLLYSVNYVLTYFFAHFKQYESEDKNKNLKFMLKLIEETVFYLEYTKNPTRKDIKNAKAMSKDIVEILKSEPDYLMFLYQVTEGLYSYFQHKRFTDIKLYEYLTAGMLMDFPNEEEFKGILDTTCRKIFIKRFTSYLDADLITFSNVIVGEPIYINYLTNQNSLEFLPYLFDSLEFLKDVKFTKNLKENIYQILDFKTWAPALLNALRDYNADYIDVVIDPSMGLKQVQEMLSKKMMENVKKVSMVNEQFLDYYLVLLSRTLNAEGDSFQFEFNFQKSFTIQNFFKDLELSSWKKIKENYVMLDENYFIQAYFYRTKKKISHPKKFYFHLETVLPYLLTNQVKKILLEDFQEKTVWVDYIFSEYYVEMLKTYFKPVIQKFLKKNGYKNYLKYFASYVDDFEISSQMEQNFKKNIYYPDFLVFFEWLKYNKVKIKAEDLLAVSLIKKTIFAYLIARKLISANFIKIYFKDLINFYYKDFKFNNFEKFADYFDEKYEAFIDFFAKVKQNGEFVDKMEKLIVNVPDKQRIWYVYDNLKDIGLYNKRMFKI